MAYRNYARYPGFSLDVSLTGTECVFKCRFTTRLHLFQLVLCSLKPIIVSHVFFIIIFCYLERCILERGLLNTFISLRQSHPSRFVPSGVRGEQRLAQQKIHETEMTTHQDPHGTDFGPVLRSDYSDVLSFLFIISSAFACSSLSPHRLSGLYVCMLHKL